MAEKIAKRRPDCPVYVVAADSVTPVLLDVDYSVTVKEEADILTPIIDDIKEERYKNEFECEFTRTTINDCIKNPENYGPEQRAKIMAYYYYKPDTESYDGNEECDYCHGPVGRCGGRCRDSDLY
jgi:hypothetical protein